MRAKHSFDSKCLDLARYFYPHAADHWLRDLAQQFQDVAESAEDVEAAAALKCASCDGDDEVTVRLICSKSPICKHCFAIWYDGCTDAEQIRRESLKAQGRADHWLIRKSGYYYRPNRAGYTASIAEAGRYTEAEAKAEAAIEPAIMQAVPLQTALSEGEHRG